MPLAEAKKEGEAGPTKAGLVPGLNGFETVGSQFVAVQIAGIRSVGIRSPVTRPGKAFTCTASGQCCGMKRVDCGTRRCLETDGNTIADAGRCAVSRF